MPRRFPALTVETPRVVLRPLSPADAADVIRVFDDRQARRWLSVPDPYTDDAAKAWCGELADGRREAADGDHYAVVRREDSHLVGCLWTRRTDWYALVTQVTYAVAPEARGMGLAAEALAAIAVSLLGEHELQRVELRIAVGNVASRRVAEKAGFKYEGLLRNAGWAPTGRVDLEVWSLVTADLRG